MDGALAFELYATHGLPLELTRDIAREQGLDVDQAGFITAMDEHRVVSGAGKAFGQMGGEDVDVFRGLFDQLLEAGKLAKEGVLYDPYSATEVEDELVGMVRNGQPVREAQTGDRVDLILPKTCFYIEAGGQVSDSGTIVSVSEPRWEVAVDEMRKPAAGVIIHSGIVVRGAPEVGDRVIAAVDAQRRRDIMRNHTATHLLHAELHAVLGGHARQAGSLVAPDRLRFDFTHPEAMTQEQIEQVEARVNQAILENYHLNTRVKPLQEAISEGAMALFGEKYGDVVRTVTIGEADPVSYELCGGTHVNETGDIGLFLITSEGSAAAGVRRIEAITGRGAYDLVQRRFRLLRKTSGLLGSSVDEVSQKVEGLQEDLSQARRTIATLRQELAAAQFEMRLNNVTQINGIATLAAELTGADADTLRLMTDRFRQKYPSGVVLLASIVDAKPVLIASVTEDLVRRGLNAGDLVKRAAQVVGGGGGGKPTLAQAGGRDPSKLAEALDQMVPYVKERTM